MSLDITPGDGIVGELELLGDLIVGGFPEAVFTLPGVSVDEVLDHARLYLGFAEAAESAHARVRGLEVPEFVGVEGEFFRGRVPGELAMQLGAAVESYSRVGSGIKELARELDASQAALKPLEARARAVFEHMQKVWVKVNVPFTEYSGLRSEWDELVRAAGVVHERVAVAGQQAAAAITAGTEAMVPVNDYFSSLPGGAVAGGVVAQGVRSTALRAVSAAGGVTGAPGRAAKATADGLGAVAGAVTSVPQQVTARGQQLVPQVTPDGIKVGDQLLTDPTSEQAQKLVRDGLATNILGLDSTGVPTAMMMLASPNTLLREQPRKKAAGRRWSGEGAKAQSIAESAVGQVVSVPGRFVGGAVDRFGNTIAGNAALIGVGGDPVRAWTGLLSNVTSPVAGAGRAVASATPEQILADPVAAAGSAATHAPAAVPFVGWVYGLVEWATKPGELAREGAKETLTSALDALTLKNLEAGRAVANTGEVQVTTSDVDVHADNGGYVTFTLPDLEGGEPKAWYILATPDSPGNFTTDVPTAPDEELVERADGSVVLVKTGTGQVVRTVKAPWAKDALGRDQPTWYSIEKIDDRTSTITQHIQPNKGALYPLVADATDPGGGGASGEGGESHNDSPNPPAASNPGADLAAASASLANVMKPYGPNLPTPAASAPSAPTPAPAPAVSPAAAVAALPGGTQQLIADATRKPDANVSVQLPQNGGAPTAMVGQTISSGGGQVTQSPNSTDGAVKIETPRTDGSGTSDVTAVVTAVVPTTSATSNGQGRQRVTETVTATQDDNTGAVAVTGRDRTTENVSGSVADLAARETAQREAQARLDADIPAAAGDPRPSELAQREIDNGKAQWDKYPDIQEYQKALPPDVYPISSETSSRNSRTTVTYKLSNGTTIYTYEDNSGEVVFNKSWMEGADGTTRINNGELVPYTPPSFTSLAAGLGRSVQAAGVGIWQMASDPAGTVKAMAPLVGLGDDHAPSVADSWNTVWREMAAADDYERGDTTYAAGKQIGNFVTAVLGTKGTTALTRAGSAAVRSEVERAVTAAATAPKPAPWAQAIQQSQARATAAEQALQLAQEAAKTTGKNTPTAAVATAAATGARETPKPPTPHAGRLARPTTASVPAEPRPGRTFKPFTTTPAADNAAAGGKVAADAAAVGKTTTHAPDSLGTGTERVSTAGAAPDKAADTPAGSGTSKPAMLTTDTDTGPAARASGTAVAGGNTAGSVIGDAAHTPTSPAPVLPERFLRPGESGGHPYTVDELQGAYARSVTDGVPTDHRTGHPLVLEDNAGGRGWVMRRDADGTWHAENRAEHPNGMPKTGTPGSYGYDQNGNLLRYAEHRPPHTAKNILTVWNTTRQNIINLIDRNILDLPTPGANQSWLRTLENTAGPEIHTVWNALENRWETYRLVKWEPGDKPRPWDMGHTTGDEYRKLHDAYMRGPGNGGITEKQFLEEYTDADLYEASTPERNSSHIDEDKTPLPPRP